MLTDDEILEAAGRQYREACGSIAVHLDVQRQAELAQAALLTSLRGVPRDELYDRATGEATDPRLIAAEGAIAAAMEDVTWCRSVTVACGEVVKGEPLEVVIARNAEPVLVEAVD